MKRILTLLAALALCLCLIIPAGAAAAASAADATSAGLKFKDDGTFKIIHVADTQEFILSSALTQEFLYDLAKKEQPDLFVLTGDNTSTGGASGLPKPVATLLVKSGVDGLMRTFDRIYKELGVPVTMVYGNHDNEAGPDNVSRAEQFAMYAAHPSFAGYYVEDADKGTGKNDEQGDHYGTHNLIVKNSAGTAPAFNIWMFDSGSYETREGGGYSAVMPAQIAWFQAEHARTGSLPSVAFQHIIVPEIYDKLTPSVKDAPDTMSRTFVVDHETGATVTKYVSTILPAGTQGELLESCGSGRYNYGQYDALCAAGVSAVFSGHDHRNTFVLRLDGETDIVNSPATGFGSYGEVETRAARVITLKESDPDAYETKIVSYQAFYGPNTLRRTRLAMFQQISAFGNLIDWMTFRPLFWLLDLFGMTPAYMPAA